MEAPVYSFRPNLFTKELTVTLLSDEFEMSRAGDLWRMSFADVRRVRIFAAPVGAGREATFCYIVPQHGRTLKLRSVSMAGIGKFDDRSAQFLAFMQAMVPRLAAANPQVEFISGPSMATWITYLFIVVAGAAILAIAIFAAIAGALPGGSWASFIILAVFIPGLWRVVRRGRPRRFDPTQLDDRVLAGGR